MYKYEEGTDLDYQYYTLVYNIISNNNNKLYIAIADVGKALNCSCVINANKQISINTMENLAKLYQEKLKDSGYEIVKDQNNQKALSYGWIIASRNGTYSVLDTNLEEIIGRKYLSIYFDECNLNYIVSNMEGLYGIIANTGVVQMIPKYNAGLEILNYENMLYKAKNNGKYGIVKADGTSLVEIEYEDIGYKAEPSNKILYTLIVPELNAQVGKTIVVKQNNKYGLVSLQTGKVYLPCDHLDKLYSVNDLGKVQYRIEAEKQTMELSRYLQIRGIQ